MAMSRFFSQALTRKSLLHPHPTIHQRHGSNKPNRAQVIEVDLDSQNDPLEGPAAGIQKLEEVLQSIIARRAAPDWLPFLPGYSYYVPPPPPTHNLIDVLGKLSHAPHLSNPSLSRDATAPFTKDLGWPSSTYFIEGTAPTHLPVGSVKVVNMYDCDEAAQESSSEDECDEAASLPAHIFQRG